MLLLSKSKTTCISWQLAMERNSIKITLNYTTAQLNKKVRRYLKWNFIKQPCAFNTLVNIKSHPFKFITLFQTVLSFPAPELDISSTNLQKGF